MKIREVGQKAENLIEQGERAKQQQAYYQRAAASARSQLMTAYAMLEAASETDDEGNPRGDTGAAQAQIYAAQVQLASAERGLQEAAATLRGIDQQKRETITDIERYTEGETKNLSKLHELQKKSFGGNVNAFIADIVGRMNSGEQARVQLLRSLGQNTTAKTFSGSSVGVAGSVGSVQSSNMPPEDILQQSLTSSQLEQYRSLRRQLHIAQLLDLRHQLTHAQALQLLMQESDQICKKKPPRTPNQILSDMKISIRENWMNNFNADQWKSILSEKMYLERLELYRKGLAYEIGQEAASKLTIEQLEQLSRERNLAFISGKQMTNDQLKETATLLQASSTNSYERSKSDSVVPQLPSALSRDLVSMIPESRRSALDTAYANAPERITRIINRFSPQLQRVQDSGYGFNKKGEYVKQGSYYSPQYKTIAMNEHMTNDEYTDVFKHEYGHFVDHMLGNASDSPSFVSAIESVSAKFNPKTTTGRQQLQEMLDDAFSTGACYDRNVTDIISALLLNDPIVVNRFHEESVTGYVAYYQHDTAEYWNLVDKSTGKSYNMRGKDTFANLFAIETDGYRISKNFVERWFPEIIEEFNRQLDGGE